MKFLLVVIIALFFTLPVFSQNRGSLDKSLSAMFKQNFPDWTAENGEPAFYPMIQNTWKFNPKIHKAEAATDLHSIWTKDRKKVQISMRVVDDRESEQSLRMFTIRNITPPSYKIKISKTDAYLIKFHDRVEIAFVKFNVYTRVDYSFPSKYKKPPYLGTAESVDAPPAEVDFALKIARLITDEINAIQTTETLTGVQISQPAN